MEQDVLIAVRRVKHKPVISGPSAVDHRFIGALHKYACRIVVVIEIRIPVAVVAVQRGRDDQIGFRAGCDAFDICVGRGIDVDRAALLFRDLDVVCRADAVACGVDIRMSARDRDRAALLALGRNVGVFGLDAVGRRGDEDQVSGLDLDRIVALERVSVCRDLQRQVFDGKIVLGLDAVVKRGFNDQRAASRELKVAGRIDCRILLNAVGAAAARVGHGVIGVLFRFHGHLSRILHQDRRAAGRGDRSVRKEEFDLVLVARIHNDLPVAQCAGQRVLARRIDRVDRSVRQDLALPGCDGECVRRDLTGICGIFKRRSV